jgi:4-alpha-glucanotransferase
LRQKKPRKGVKMELKRQSGILMPVASLPAKYGIGTLGKSAYDFVDFLKKAKQSVWQILPLVQTGFGDSPYQSCSAFAGNPYFIDLDILEKDGLLKKSEYAHVDFGKNENEVDYEKLHDARYGVLRLAFERFAKWFPDGYYRFCFEQGWWLEDYALYMTAKGISGDKCYLDWDADIRAHRREAIDKIYAEHEKEVHFWKFCQYQFSLQWTALKAYANENGIKIMGDIPIYVASDSADVWAGSELFSLDENGLPREVAGCPPDYFAPDGQLWGNPLYDWPHHAATKYEWWIKRIRYATSIYDIVRIDHFRAFDTYYAILYGDTTAKNGKWCNGPRMELFDAVHAALGEVPVVAEDLGDIFDSVRDLLKASGFPGMKVTQFAFDGGDNEYLPHNFPVKCVAYTGTHDNTTIADWYKTAPAKTRKNAKEYLGISAEEGVVRAMLRGVMSSTAYLCIVAMPDWLGLGANGRINTPSTLGGKNWVWRAAKPDFSPALAKRIAHETELYGRA